MDKGKEDKQENAKVSDFLIGLPLPKTEKNRIKSNYKSSTRELLFPLPQKKKNVERLANRTLIILTTLF